MLDCRARDRSERPDCPYHLGKPPGRRLWSSGGLVRPDPGDHERREQSALAAPARLRKGLFTQRDRADGIAGHQGAPPRAPTAAAVRGRASQPVVRTGALVRDRLRLPSDRRVRPRSSPAPSAPWPWSGPTPDRSPPARPALSPPPSRRPPRRRSPDWRPGGGRRTTARSPRRTQAFGDPPSRLGVPERPGREPRGVAVGVHGERLVPHRSGRIGGVDERRERPLRAGRHDLDLGEVVLRREGVLLDAPRASRAPHLLVERRRLREVQVVALGDPHQVEGVDVGVASPLAVRDLLQLDDQVAHEVAPFDERLALAPRERRQADKRLGGPCRVARPEEQLPGPCCRVAADLAPSTEPATWEYAIQTAACSASASAGMFCRARR